MGDYFSLRKEINWDGKNLNKLNESLKLYWHEIYDVTLHHLLNRLNHNCRDGFEKKTLETHKIILWKFIFSISSKLLSLHCRNIRYFQWCTLFVWCDHEIEYKSLWWYSRHSISNLWDMICFISIFFFIIDFSLNFTALTKHFLLSLNYSHKSNNVHLSVQKEEAFIRLQRFLW